MNTADLKQVSDTLNVSLRACFSVHPLCIICALLCFHWAKHVAQISYASSLWFLGWYKHCNEWYHAPWTVPQLSEDTTAFFPLGICFTCLQWKFVCASTSPWEATGLGCVFLEQKAPKFLLFFGREIRQSGDCGFTHTCLFYVTDRRNGRKFQSNL